MFTWRENVPSYQNRPSRLLNLHVFTLLEHERRAHDTLPHILNVLDDSLEVRCSIVGASDEDVVVLAVCCGSVQRRDGDESRRYSEVINTLYLEQLESKNKCAYLS